MQKILVAGGAGFIGSHLIKNLLENYTVFCLDNLITGEKENLNELESNPNFHFLNYDISETIPESLFKDYDLKYIFHLASPASPNAKCERSYINNPIETLRANSFGTYNLLELAKKHNASFLYASSSEVYGDPSVSPQREDYFGNVNPNGIRSVYDEGKRFGEAVSMAYFRKFKLNIRIVRVFNTYGPKMRADDGRVVSNFINQAIQNKPITIYGDGSQTRSFCYISDMVDGFKRAMFSEKSKGEVFNLGNPHECSILELASLIKKLTNTNSGFTYDKLPQDDPKTRRPDIDKAKTVLEWQPKVNIEEGLKKTIEYFKNL